jgi:hypothetical protein
MISSRSVVALVGTLLLALGSTPAVHAQAQRWVVPNHAINFSDSGPIVTPLEPPHIIPDLPPPVVTNGAFDSNGNLLFYVISTPKFTSPFPFPGNKEPSSLWILDGQGNLIDSIEHEGSLQRDDGINQIAVFAVPGACDQFFIVYFLSIPGTQNTTVSLRYSVVDVVQKKLVQKDIELPPISCLEPINPSGAIAVSRLRKDQTRFLYALACGELDKFVVGPIGISLDSVLLDTRAVGVTADDFDATQTTLSPDGKKLAWSNGGKRILLVDLDPDSGDNVNNQPTIHTVGSATVGLAFNPGSTLLFLSPSAQQGGLLSYIDLVHGTIQTIPNSARYAGSLLQLAADHKIYAASDSDLGAINPNPDPPQFMPAVVPGIVAPAPKSNNIARMLPYQINGEAQLTCENLCGNPALIQSNIGRQGNFELVVPYPGGGLAYYSRDNDNGKKWSGPYVFGTNAGAVDAVSMIQSSSGQLEVVARVGDHLVHFQGTPPVWSGPDLIPLGVSVSGTPSFIQGRFGDPGSFNFELVTPLVAGGMAHFWRNNARNATPPQEWITTPPTIITTNRVVSDVSLVQGNLGPTFDNLEVVARIDDQLFHFFRDSPSLHWYEDAGSTSFGPAVSGTPSFIQGRFGSPPGPGNFELAAPIASGGMVQLWRDNSNIQWTENLPPFGSGTVRSVALIQSNYGNNLEVVARIGCSLVAYYRDSDLLAWHQTDTIIP